MEMSKVIRNTVGMVLFSGALFAAPHLRAQEQPVEALWYVSAGLGLIQFEGDEELEDGYLITARLGYDYSEWWSFEGAFSWAPKLEENMRYDVPTGTEVSRLEEAAGEGVHDTYAVGLALDALFHFTRWERLDPYLSIGAGAVIYGDKMHGDNMDTSLRGGGGVLYHFNDEWAARVDGRAFFAGEDTEANAIIDAGVIWTWGARLPPNILATDGPIDSDGDRLSDLREGELGTDPYNPDTDGDKLSDGEEVLDYHTRPLEPDTDWDGLKDGEEVHQYETDPLLQDTDNGGVADGHEVIEDGTDPRKGHGADDLQLFRLYIRFDYDKATIKPEYFSELDIIGKVLKRHDASTAVVEGHADRKKLSDAKYNMELSERRAKAVVAYLVDKAGIEAGRLKAVGYGFERPQAPNDPKVGNPANRRVEVYIRGAREDDAESVVGADAPVPEDK